ncbi:MAG: substrate-binding domain-containing protein [Verrucomicrobiota bacterium]
MLFITDFYQEEVLLGVVEHARLAGWELISNMRFHGMFPSESEADGILVTAVGPRVRRWMKKWRDTPIVQIGGEVPDWPYPSVEVDYGQAARVAARHLMELGHGHHAFYSLVSRGEVDLMRSAFQAELEQAGLSAHHLDFEAVYGPQALEVPREERLRWLAAELSALKKPLAVMGDDDRRALELMAACSLAGLRVPEDVAIVGCENRNIEGLMAPVPLSSVDTNWRRVGREAAVLLDRLMAGEKAAVQRTLIPPRGVVARASTATFVTDSSGITRALLHIRENFPHPIRLNGLARMAGMAERQFRDEFKRLVGRGPRAEIHRARLACAARLLRDTDLKLDAIAVESGLGTARKLCEIFAEVHQMTPTAWRQQARQD